MLGAFIVVTLIIFGAGALLTILALIATPTEALVAPINERVTCAVCARKFHREHCVPVKRGGAIVWMCHDEIKKGLDKAS